MIAPTSTENGVQTDGFAIVEDVLSRQNVDDLLYALERIGDTGSVRKRGGIFGVRNLLYLLTEVRELADSDAVRMLVEPLLGAHFFPVRGILFDKIPDANWKVPWHQDVTIAVRERVETDGFGPWSMKADVVHVQPPVAILKHYAHGAFASRSLRRRERGSACSPWITHARQDPRGGDSGSPQELARGGLRGRTWRSVANAASPAPCLVPCARPRASPCSPLGLRLRLPPSRSPVALRGLLAEGRKSPSLLRSGRKADTPPLKGSCSANQR